jgi:hypothetical protein
MVTINPCDFGPPIPCGVNPAYTYTRYPCDHDDPRPTDTKGLPVIVDLQTNVKAEVVNRHRESILAIEGELGIEPSGTYTTVRARLDEMEALLCAVWQSIGTGVRVLFNTLTVTNDVAVKEINFFGAGVTVTEDTNFDNNGRVNVYIPCCGGGALCIDGYQPIHESLTVATNNQTAFTLSLTPYNNIVLMFIGGIKQDTSNYTVSGTTFTWTGSINLLTTDTVEVFYEVFHDSSYGNVYQPTLQVLPVTVYGQTAFTLGAVANNNLVDLYVNGQKQPISNYIVSGTSVTWGGYPLLFSGDKVEAYYTITGTAGDIWEPITQLLSVTTIGQISFTLSQAPWNNLVVLYIDGIKQTDFTITGTTLTWTGSTILIPGDSIDILYFNYLTGQCLGMGDTPTLSIANNGNIIGSDVIVVDFVGSNVSASNQGQGLVQVTIADNNSMYQDIFYATLNQVFFTLSREPINEANISMFINGVFQTPGVGYDFYYRLTGSVPEIVYTPGNGPGPLVGQPLRGDEVVVFKYLVGHL